MIKILSATYKDSTFGGPYSVAIDHKNSLEKNHKLYEITNSMKFAPFQKC